MDEKLQRLFENLGRAVFDAIAESEDVSETVGRFRDEGYTLSLQLDCKKEAPEAAGSKDDGAAREIEPTFRIDGQDLSFLQSIGIDPTRRRPRRR